jgi:hypothetical protein
VGGDSCSVHAQPCMEALGDAAYLLCMLGGFYIDTWSWPCWFGVHFVWCNAHPLLMLCVVC